MTQLVMQISDVAAALPPPVVAAVPITADVFGHAIAESNIIDLLYDLTGLAGTLAELDLNSPASVGRDVRRVLIATAADLSRAADLSADIAAFDPGADGRALQQKTLELISTFARVAAQYASTLIARTFEDAQSAAARSAELLEAVPWSEIRVLLNELPATSLNDRVARALGRDGDFVDDCGNIDLGQIVRSFAQEPDRWNSLGQAAITRFSTHLAGREPEPSAATGLILPLLAMARVTRPLSAERAARSTAALFVNAAEADEEKTLALLNAMSDHGPRLVAIGIRVDELLQRVHHALAGGSPVDDATIHSLLDAYRSLCEGPWRELGWGLVRAQVIAEQGEPPVGRSPDVADLKNRLAAMSQFAADALAAGVDPSLRNAAAHEQWTWQSDSRTLESTDGSVWSLDEILDLLNALTASLAGTDAGWIMGVLASGIETAHPQWMEEGQSPGVVALNAVLTVGLAGCTVTDVENRGHIVRIAESVSEVDEQALMSGLVGTAMHRTVTSGDAFQIIDRDGVTVFDVDASDLVLAASELERHATLAAYVPFASTRIRQGREPAVVLEEMIAGQVMVAAGPLISALTDAVPVSTIAAQLVDSLEFIVMVAERWEDVWDHRTRRLVQRLQTLTRHAERSAAQPSAKDHLSSAGLDLVRWASPRQGSLLPRDPT